MDRSGEMERRIDYAGGQIVMSDEL
jgi:hypothetical protein